MTVKNRSRKLERRESIRVSRKRFELIGRRERLNNLLRQHDLEQGPKPQILDETDQVILRQIAQEGAMTNNGPAGRAAAIYYLSKLPSLKNLNLLYELAQYGEDFYVRSQALLGLGMTGLTVAAPCLVEHLQAEERAERLAAENAFVVLGRKNGMGEIRVLLQGRKWQATLSRIERQVSRLVTGAPGKRRVKHTTTYLSRRK
jgi:hypothetical protein